VISAKILLFSTNHSITNQHRAVMDYEDQQRKANRGPPYISVWPAGKF